MENARNLFSQPSHLYVPGLAADLDTAVALPGAGADVVAGLRPQALRLVPGDTHRVEIVEALGSVTYAHLSGPEGARLTVSSHKVIHPAEG